jgi:hypothetical protein
MDALLNAVDISNIQYNISDSNVNYFFTNRTYVRNALRDFPIILYFLTWLCSAAAEWRDCAEETVSDETETLLICAPCEVCEHCCAFEDEKRQSVHNF